LTLNKITSKRLPKMSRKTGQLINTGEKNFTNTFKKKRLQITPNEIYLKPL